MTSTDRTLDLLRRADPLTVGADLDPRGATATRVRAAAMTAPPTARPRVERRRAPLRLAAAAVTAGVVAAVAIAVGVVPDGEGGGPGGGPAEARAALVSAAERTAAYTSGHIVWKMAFDTPLGGHADLSTDVRFEGSSVDLTNASLVDEPNQGVDHHRTSNDYRTVDGKAYWRYGHARRWSRAAGPQDATDTLRELRGRIEAVDALAGATRRAVDVARVPDAGGTRFTGTLAARDVPFPFLPSWTRKGNPRFALVAVVGLDGTVRSVTLRGNGTHVDIRFDAMGAPQGIVAP